MTYLYRLRGAIILSFTLLALGVCMPRSANAQSTGQAEAKRQFDIPEGDARPMLLKFADQANCQIVFDANDVAGATTRAVKGEYRTHEALDIMLLNTGLVASFDPKSGAIAIRKDNTGDKDAHRPTTAPNSEGNEAGAKTGAEPLVMNQMTVNADKGDQLALVMDIPNAISVVSAQTLIDQNQFSFQDYYSNFPGLSFGSGNRGEIFPDIRGISSGAYTTSTVGIVIDGVPYGGSNTDLSAPNIDPSDLKQIEVLSGPQGTLFGVGSLGGLINYVTNDPSSNGVSGQLETSVSGVENGSQLGYEERGAINVPLSRTLAVRVSAYTRQDPGYIDDPQTGAKGLNEGHDDGGHFVALWTPSQKFSLKISALVQHDSQNGSSLAFTTPGFGDLQQSFLPGTGGYTRNDEIFSATMRAQLGSVNLTSISSYGIYQYYEAADYSPFFSSISEQYENVPGDIFDYWQDLRKLTEEVRLTSKIGDHVDWLLGGYFSREGLNYFTDIKPTEASGVVVPGNILSTIPNYDDDTYREAAVFADLTFHLTDRLDLQVGARQAEEFIGSITSTPSGQLYQFYGIPTTPSTSPSEKDRPFTFLFAPEFKVTPNLMIYGRISSGYRPGGPNEILPNIPSSYGPDKTTDYEVGIKANFLDEKLSLDATVYYIDWTGVQILNENPPSFQSFTENAGGAKSEGLELSASLKPIKGMTLSSWVTWDDAVITSNPPNSSYYAVPGDVLPYSTRFSANASVEQLYAVNRDWTLFANGTVSYVGERLEDFLSSAATPRADLPGYADINLRAGAKYRRWTLSVFIDNVADRRAVLYQGEGFSGESANSLLYITPRTIGTSLSLSF
jgi:iron complex outermembrane receptor protein